MPFLFGCLSRELKMADWSPLSLLAPLLQTLSLKVEGTRKLQLRAFEHDVSYIAVFHTSTQGYQKAVRRLVVGKRTTK